MHRDEIEAAGLKTLISSPETGPCLVEDESHRALYVFNHFEYDSGTLKEEYDRDIAAGKTINVPKNYYPDDDPTRKPANNWRIHAHLLFGNWINEILPGHALRHGADRPLSGQPSGKASALSPGPALPCRRAGRSARNQTVPPFSLSSFRKYPGGVRRSRTGQSPLRHSPPRLCGHPIPCAPSPRRPIVGPSHQRSRRMGKTDAPRTSRAHPLRRRDHPLSRNRRARPCPHRDPDREERRNPFEILPLPGRDEKRITKPT